jgi:hypothetical protein
MSVLETTFNPISISSVSASPATPSSSQSVTVTVTLSGAKNTSENVFLRYSTDNFATSTYVQINSFIANAGTAVIPAQAVCTTVSYYALTTAEATPVDATIDYLTLNLNNNANANYSYVVSGGTCCPSHTCTNGTFTSGTSFSVAAGQVKCISGNYTSGTVTVSGGTLYIESGASIDMASRMSYNPRTASSITRNCGTVTWSLAQDYDMKNATAPGAGVIATAGNFMTTENYGTWTVSTGATKTFYIDDYDQVKNYGTMDFGGHLELRLNAAPGYFLNDAGATTNITTQFDVKGTVDQKGTLITPNLTLINDANTRLNVFNASITRITSNLNTSGANKVFAGDNSGTAYINNVGSGTSGSNSITSATAGLITYCGPYITAPGVCGHCGTATLGTNCSYPLPVELLEFKALEEDHTVRLEWTTASEKDNAYFTVEKSLDGWYFETIARITGSGTSNFSQSYLIYDHQKPWGICYYRLVQTDRDGQSETFEPIVFKRKSAVNQWTVFPNPSDGHHLLLHHFRQDGDRTNTIIIELIDTQGNLIIRKTTMPQQKEVLIPLLENHPSLEHGLYFIRIISPQKIEIEKIMVE